MPDLDQPLPSLSGSMSNDTPQLTGGFGGNDQSPALVGSMNFTASLPQIGEQAKPGGSFDTRALPSLTSRPTAQYDSARAFMR